MANNSVPVTPEKPKNLNKISHQGVTAVKGYIKKLRELLATDIVGATGILIKIQEWKANYDTLNTNKNRQPFKQFWDDSPSEARIAMAELLYLGDDQSEYSKVKAEYEAKVQEILADVEEEESPPPNDNAPPENGPPSGGDAPALRPNNDINNFEAPSEVSDPYETGSSSSSGEPPGGPPPGDNPPPGGDPPPVPATDAVNDPKDTDEVLVDDENIDDPPQDESLRSQLGIPEHSGAFPEPTISGNRKWGPDRAEWQKEDQRRRMQQSPHDRLRTAEALLIRGNEGQPKFSTDERIGVSSGLVSDFENLVIDQSPQAMAQKRVGMAMQLADDIFAADFRAWLTNGRTIIHEKPEVRSVVAKRPGNRAFRFQRDRDPQTRISENKQYRLPATPLWSSLHKIRGAQEYIDTFVDQEAAFQRKLNAMLLRGPQTVDEAFWYYKFVIRGEVASAEDKELFNQL